MHLPSSFWILISIGLTLYIIIDERIFNQLPNKATILAQIETIGDRFSPFDFNLTTYSLETIDIFDTCNLTIYDPYYKDMGMTVNWDNPIANCDRNHTPYTILKDGRLSIDPKRKNQVDYCRARTYEYIHPEKSRPRPWFNIVDEMQIKHDIVTTECYSKDGKVVDQWLHSQIYEGNPSTVEVNESLGNRTDFRPDIVMIVLDSVSSTQARRSLPRTLSFLETQMGGMHFHHLNKVGENTRPNAYAMLLGWRIFSANRKAVNAQDLKPDHDKICSGWRDKDPVIFREYEKIGYKTLYSDDYKQGTGFSWSCKGFKKQEANHIWRDYLWAWHNENKLRNFMSPNNCFEMHVGQLQQSTNFLNAYNGTPKFLLHWSGEASHDAPNRLYHTDQDYLNFFQKNEAILENAFLFVMGDHGPRFGPPSKAELNKREINNPLLHISLPKFLRNHTQLIKNLQDNSVRLLTQFDVHATLVDLLKFAPESKFTDFSELDVMEGNENNGTSIFRPFPEKFQKRTCQTIPTNAAYCLCEYKKEKLDDAMLIERLVKAALEDLNGYLRENGVGESCEMLTFDKLKSVNAFIPVEKTNLYEIQFIVKESKGEFAVVS